MPRTRSSLLGLFRLRLLWHILHVESCRGSFLSPLLSVNWVVFLSKTHFAQQVNLLVPIRVQVLQMLVSELGIPASLIPVPIRDEAILKRLLNLNVL